MKYMKKKERDETIPRKENMKEGRDGKRREHSKKG